MPPGPNDRYYIGEGDDEGGDYDLYNYNNYNHHNNTSSSNTTFRTAVAAPVQASIPVVPPLIIQTATPGSSRVDLIPQSQFSASIPRRKEVPTHVDDQVSPLETRAPTRHPTNASASVITPLSPQRVGTVSSGGRHTVSPASSIREVDDDEEDEEEEKVKVDKGKQPQYVYRGGFSSSPAHHRDAAQQQQQQRGGGGGGASVVATTPWPRQLQHHEIPRTGNIPLHWYDDRIQKALPPTPKPEPEPAIVLAPQPAPTMWQAQANPRAFDPHSPPPHYWRGSQDLQELNEARARAAQPGRGPIRTSYGPAPMPNSAPDQTPAPAPISTPPPAQLRPEDAEISPAPPTAAWPNRQQRQRSPSQQRARAPGQTAQRNDGTGPYMHYEDLDYFNPGPGTEPKDESQIDSTAPRADTFPNMPDALKRLKGKRSWDRQRKRRKVAGEKGSGRTRKRSGGGCGRFLEYCMHWLPEMVWCFISIVCLVAIIMVLKAYDGYGLPNWPLAVSLNTLIAWLAAVCQVALAVPLGEGLSQLKWNSFARGEKPLSDFGTFEDVKRGPVGSAKLLLRRKGRVLGMSAATMLLTGFALTPLTQAAISYRTRRFAADGGTATIARSESYSHTEPYEDLDPREKQAIQLGLYHPIDLEAPHVQPFCSSGECQWSSFSSLAVCAAVADVSDKLTVSNETRASNTSVSLGVANGEPVHNASLPNGIFLLGSTTTCNLNLSWPLTAGGQGNFVPVGSSLAFPAQDGRVASAIANFFVVYTNQTAESSSTSQQRAAFRAVEVLFHFCVNTYDVSTSRGVSTSSVIHSSTLAAQGVSGRSLVTEKRDDSTPPQGVSLRPRRSDEGVYSVKNADVRLLNSYLRSVLSGTYSIRYGRALGGETSASQVVGSTMFRGDARAPALDDAGLRAAIGNLTGNMATSLTNTIRSGGSQTAVGSVLSNESYIEVRWAWLSFLGLQVAVSAAFLLGIMVQTAVWKVKIIKGSAVASLFAIPADDKARLEDEDRIILNIPNSDKDDAIEARKLRGITSRFVLSDRGWVLDLSREGEG